MRYKIKCAAQCCPEVGFLEDGRLELSDDYGGKIVITRPEFGEWVEENVHGDPEEEGVIYHGDSSIRVFRWQVAALHDAYAENVGNHPALTQQCSI